MEGNITEVVYRPHNRWLVEPVNMYTTNWLIRFPDLEFASFHNNGFLNDSKTELSHRLRHGGGG